MAVLPEDMNRIDPASPEESIRVIDQYIRYMGERLEFSFSQMTKNITAAGASNVEIYILITAMNNQLSAMQSSINNMLGRLNGIDGTLSALQGDITSIQGDIASLDQRVTALEQQNT